MYKHFDETFPQIQYDIETPIPTGKRVTPKESNTKTILKPEAKIFVIKSYLDCISVLSDKTSTFSARIYFTLKAIKQKQEKTIKNLE